MLDTRQNCRTLHYGKEPSPPLSRKTTLPKLHVTTSYHQKLRKVQWIVFQLYGRRQPAKKRGAGKSPPRPVSTQQNATRSSLVGCVWLRRAFLFTDSPHLLGIGACPAESVISDRRASPGDNRSSHAPSLSRCCPGSAGSPSPTRRADP